MAKSTNKPSAFTTGVWMTIGLFVVFAMIFTLYVHSEKQIDRTNNLRIRSILLARELRQSSDDLTKMARNYVITGKPIFKQHFQEILDIRDGKTPRPIDYYDIYWDLVLDDDQRPRPFSDKTISLLHLMRQVGFTDEEFQKLSQAKMSSDALTATEYAAMSLAESSTSLADEARMQAIQMLHDTSYHKAKADILRPLSEFEQLMNNRMLTAVHVAEQAALLIRVVFIVFGLLLLIMLLRTYKALFSILGGSVDELHAHITKIGGGDFSGQISVIPGMEHSVLGWLSQTHQNLNKINEARNSAENRIRRLMQLYAALSQCNQAIVRAKDETELFPQICRDAVDFGKMKMAWIGMLDPETGWVTPAASVGEGIEYLKDIRLSVDPTSPYGKGPTGTAIRTGEVFWCQDFLNDPRTTPWHERGCRFGWRSSAALPLHRNGAVCGSLNVYAGEVGAFDEAEKNLLLEMAMDISYAIDRFELERQQANLTEQLRMTQSRMDSILNSIDQIIWSVDANTQQILFLNAAVAPIYGRTADEFFNHPQLWLESIHADDITIAIDMERKTRERGKDSAEYRIVRPTGDVRWIANQAWRVCAEDGSLLRIDGLVSDITERKLAESHIQHLAYYDALTGLPNRTLLDDRLTQAISAAIRNNNQFVLMFLDLDHFKNINDTLGHRIGDQLLIQASQRMIAAVRNEDTVARPGGDEFILILLDTNTDGATHVADKILTTLSLPYIIDGHELVVTPSIGISVYPNDGHDFQTLAQCADAAMYRAKQEGRNGYRFFSPEMQANSARILLLENALRKAVEHQQFCLHYQPQFSVTTGEIIGAEALIRWHHPDLGIISPAEFIPIAESSGQIIAIGTWVIRTALEQLKQWLNSGMAPMIMAVNLSAVQFRYARLPELVSQILNEIGLPASFLELELTEGVAMDDPDTAIAIMDNLHARGVRMSVDDFGTGYSSLSYLKRFKVYKLKIDQSFVRDITDDPEDRAIVTAIINLSRSLGFQTIAEGVETESQLAFLREQGCDEVQGYYFSKPLPAEQFAEFVQRHSAIPLEPRNGA